MDRRLLLLGLVVLASAAALALFVPGVLAALAPPPGAPRTDPRLHGAGILVLLLLGVAAIGLDWRDWL